MCKFGVLFENILIQKYKSKRMTEKIYFSRLLKIVKKEKREKKNCSSF